MKHLLFVIICIVSIAACKQSAKEAVKKDFEFPFQNPELVIDERIKDLVSRLTLEEKCSQMLYNSPAIERLNIPEYNWWSEALHGVARTGRATVFPQCIGLAASFDDSLIFDIATAISDEARAKFNIAQQINNRGQYAGLGFWSPNVNIFRDPRWGRGQETWGEDPYLSGRLGSQFVRGMQGNDSNYLKTAACAKHYVVHSGPEGERHTFNAIPSQKDFFETYLPAFETLVKEAKVEAVMCAYNRTFDLPCCGSSYLLTQVLREKWGFKGHIVSDCGAIMDFHTTHKSTTTVEESAAMAANAGVNLNCGPAYKSLAKAVQMGLVKEDTINVRLTTLLRTRFKLGLFDPIGYGKYDHLDESVIDSKKNRELSKRAAQASIVMLKNKNNVLPLKKDAKLYHILGPTASSMEVLLGNYYGLNGNMVTIVEGITQKVSAGTSVEYRMGITLDRENINPIDWTTGEDAHKSDAIIVVAGISGLLEGEEGESLLSPNLGDRADIKLPQNQINYIKKLNKNGNAPIVLVLTGGSPIDISDVIEEVDAILFAWYPGQEGGTAVADVLFGDYNPSGKLPLTFITSAQLKDYGDYSMKGRTYRFMEEAPLYPFGFGLSYTQFEYSNLSLSAINVNQNEDITASVTIKNTGKYDGNEIAQLYISVEGKEFETPIQSLIDFKKVFLKQGESKTVTFKINSEKLMVYDKDGNKIFIPGNIKISVGGAAPIQRSIDLGASKSLSTDFILK